MKKIIIGLVGLLLTTVSCNEDAFTKYVEVDIPDDEQRLVLLASLNAENDVHRFVISNTLNINDEPEFENLEVDEIKFITPDQGIINPEIDGNTYVIENYKFLSGADYSIEISDSDWPAATSTIRTPKEVDVIEVKADTLDDFGRISHLFEITINDPEDEKNYYLFSGTSEVELADNEICISDYYFDYLEEDIISEYDWISDFSFNGQSKTIKLKSRVRCSGDASKSVAYRLNIISVPAEFVEYDKSIDLAYEAQDNPFVEPTTLFTNVEGGLGIFSIATSTVFTGEF